MSLPSSKEDDAAIQNGSKAETTEDIDVSQLRKLGYRQQLHRSWQLIESFATGFVSLNFIGYIRSYFFIGLQAGGPAAIWSTYVVSFLFMMMNAAVLAEICSAFPVSGSIYIWAAESAGPKYARFFGFLVAWWVCASWTTGISSLSQVTANYVVSQLAIWEVGFPGGIDNSNIKWRAFIWVLSELILLISVSINYLPPRLYSRVFKFSIWWLMFDFLICLIWLPIGASRTYGFRSASEVFTMTYNGTGAPAGWNWLLCFLFTSGTMSGVDASGHIAEETKNASVNSARGILMSAITTGVLGFFTVLLILFCMPDIDTVFTLNAPQPFVQIYALALGKKASIFMTTLSVISNILEITVEIVAVSRLVFAVSRDGLFPMSGWIAQVDKYGQPRNAVTAMYMFSATILCLILPSQVTFTSLVAGCSSLMIASYGLISLLRLIMTPNEFRSSQFSLDRFSKPCYFGTAVFCAVVFAVEISPFYFPISAQTFNFGVVIFSAISIFALFSWYFISTDKWLGRSQIIGDLAMTID